MNPVTPDDVAEMAAVKFRIPWHGRQFEAEAQIPTAPVRPRFLLPMVQQIAGSLVDLAVDAIQRNGAAVSCKAGCGACCRQVVPITETEARHIRDLVEAMPESRRQQVRGRFAAGRQRLADAGLLEAFQNPTEMPDRVAAGMEYFRLGIACPFLEDESCSIHPDRPLSCREYLVASPAENCRAPSPETIRQVLLPARPMPAFSTLDGLTPDGGKRWVPLLLAPEWADAHPEPDDLAPANELFARFMKALAASRPTMPAPEKPE